MGNRSDDLTGLARDVLAAFGRLPHCPADLTATADGTGNVRLELYGRVFTINALVVDRAMMTTSWCEHVLALLRGNAVSRVAEVARRAAVSAGLTAAELAVMQEIQDLGVLQREQRPTWVTVLHLLVDAGLVEVLEGPEDHSYALTEIGKDALAAHRA